MEKLGDLIEDRGRKGAWVLYLSWFLAAALFLGSAIAGVIELKRIDLPRPIASEESSDSTDESELSDDQEGETARKYLLEKISTTLPVPKERLVLETPGVKPFYSIVLVASADDKEKKRLKEAADRCADDLAFALRLMHTGEISVRGASGESNDFLVNPLLDHWPSFSTETVSLLEKLPKTDANYRTAQELRLYLLGRIEHLLDLHLKKNPFDLEIQLYRIVVRREAGKDTTVDIKTLPALFKHSSPFEEARARTLERILLAENPPANEQELRARLEELEHILSRSWFREKLLQSLCVQAGRADMAQIHYQRALEECDNSVLTIIILIAIWALGLLLSLFLWRDRRSNIDFKDHGTAAEYAFGLWKPWAIIIASTVVSTIAFVAILLLMPSLHSDDRSMVLAYFNPTEYGLASLIEFLVITLPILILTWLIVDRKLPFLKFIRFTRAEGYDLPSMLKMALKVFSISMTTIVVSCLLSEHYFYPPEDAYENALALMAATGSFGAIVVLILMIGLVPPFIEEALFRGILYCGLRRHWGVIPSAVVTSVLFALLHGQMLCWLLVDKFVFGMVTCLATEKTGSIIPAIIVHAATNCLMVLLMILLTSH